MGVLMFWVLWVTLTIYLLQQWQRYEPTRVVLDGLAAIASFPIALAVLMAL